MQSRGESRAAGLTGAAVSRRRARTRAGTSGQDPSEPHWRPLGPGHGAEGAIALAVRAQHRETNGLMPRPPQHWRAPGAGLCNRAGGNLTSYLCFGFLTSWEREHQIQGRRYAKKYPSACCCFFSNCLCHPASTHPPHGEASPASNTIQSLWTE